MKEIERIAKPISALDKDALKVEKKENPDESQHLFKNLENAIPKSYDLAYRLCSKFNPRAGTNDAGRLNDDIDEFLSFLSKDPVIIHALTETNTNIQDLKKNWFGTGLGFEHVIAGELRGSKVSGYHWWYRFYVDERQGQAQFVSEMTDSDDDSVFTGSFFWDPDGKEGPLPNARKPKGGFSIGNSVQAILAIGHIAIETAKKHGSVPGAMTFYADINGETFTWQLYTMGGNIRSLFPREKKRRSFDYTSESYYCEEFFELEAELLGDVTQQPQIMS